MGLPSKPPKPTRAAQPQHQAFDPWVSVAAGHQVAESSVGTHWRVSRNAKLAGQFSGGRGGGKREYDSSGPGAEHLDEKLGGIVVPKVRSLAMSNIRDMLLQPGLMKEEPKGQTDGTLVDRTSRQGSKDTAGYGNNDDPTYSMPYGGLTAEQLLSITRVTEDVEAEKAKAKGLEAKQAGKRIFEGVTVYVNGSTFPLISDHKLKHLLAEHGGSVSLYLGRRTVTHVVIGRPVGRAGAGGGLAGGKLEKEIRKTAGAAVKFVGVEWILESVRAGKRLPEARFATLKMARQGQASVYSLFSKGNGLSSASESR